MSHVKDCSTCWHCNGLSHFLAPWGTYCRHPTAANKNMVADYEFIHSCRGRRWESKYADERREAKEKMDKTA